MSMLFLTLLAVAPQSAAPADTVAAPTVAPTRTPAQAALHAKAMKLADLIRPETAMTDSNDEEYVEATKQVIVGRGTLSGLEQKYPGIIDAMVRGSLPTIKERRLRRLPALRESLADLYVKTFTSAELDQMLAFYGSPTGLKMRTLLNQRTKPTATIRDITKNPDRSISPGSLRTDVTAAVPSIMDDLTPRDRATLLAFKATSAFRKLPAMETILLQIMADWMHQSSPDDLQEIRDAMIAARDAFIKAKDSGQ